MSQIGSINNDTSKTLASFNSTSTSLTPEDLQKSLSQLFSHSAGHGVSEQAVVDDAYSLIKQNPQAARELGLTVKGSDVVDYADVKAKVTPSYQQAKQALKVSVSSSSSKSLQSIEDALAENRLNEIKKLNDNIYGGATQATIAKRLSAVEVAVNDNSPIEKIDQSSQPSVKPDKPEPGPINETTDKKPLKNNLESKPATASKPDLKETSPTSNSRHFKNVNLKSFLRGGVLSGAGLGLTAYEVMTTEGDKKKALAEAVGSSVAGGIASLAVGAVVVGTAPVSLPILMAAGALSVVVGGAASLAGATAGGWAYDAATQ